MDNKHYQANAVDSAPELSTLSSEGYPTNGSPSLGIPATQPGAAWFHAVASEIANAISKGGLTPSNNSVSQLAEAMVAIVGKYGCPAGTIIPFAGTTTVPDNFLLCNGALISRTTYSDLFAAIGTAYGAGDGSTTFALPDYRDRVLQGASASHAAGTYVEAGLPNITGQLTSPDYVYGANRIGAMYADGYYSNAGGLQGSGVTRAGNVLFSAKLSNSIYGANTTVQPPASSVQYLIKY